MVCNFHYVPRHWSEWSYRRARHILMFPFRKSRNGEMILCGQTPLPISCLETTKFVGISSRNDLFKSISLYAPVLDLNSDSFSLPCFYPRRLLTSRPLSFFRLFPLAPSSIDILLANSLFVIILPQYLLFIMPTSSQIRRHHRQPYLLQPLTTKPENQCSRSKHPSSGQETFTEALVNPIPCQALKWLPAPQEQASHAGLMSYCS